MHRFTANGRETHPRPTLPLKWRASGRLSLEGEGFGSAVLEGGGSYRLRASAWPDQAGAARPSGRATEMSSTSCSPYLTTSTFTASTPPLTYLTIPSRRSRCSRGRQSGPERVGDRKRGVWGVRASVREQPGGR